MRQTLHIFKKDIRHLWWEIALALVLLAAFAYTDARDWTQAGHQQLNRILKLLVLMGWFLLIARLIQSEALPGDKQFWLTRPYSWKSLLAAKILFVLAFVTLPLIVADSVIVTTQGFPVGAHLSGLVWMQVLWWMEFVLPLAVLAAITSGLTATVFWIVVIVAAGVTNVTQDLADPLGPLEWIGNSIYSGLTTAAIIAILVWQYARRRTVGARVVFGCTMALGSLAPILPLSGFLRLREPSSLTVALDPQVRPLTQPRPVAGAVQAEFLLRFAGVPEGLTARTDLTQVRIERADGGTILRSNPQYQSSVRDQGDRHWLQISMDRGVFERIKNQPLRIRVTLLLTLYGNPKTITLPPGVNSIPVEEIGLCDTDTPVELPYRCRAPFRGPRVRVSSEWNRDWAYTPQSPFPAELGVSPMWTFANFYSGPRSLRQEALPNVTLLMETPVMHLRRSLTIENFRLADY